MPQLRTLPTLITLPSIDAARRVPALQRPGLFAPPNRA
jgi:hypothetical protein